MRKSVKSIIAVACAALAVIGCAKQSELDKVIEWDANLIDDVELLKEQSAKMLQNIDEGLPIKSDMRVIEQTVDEMINTFRERDNVMKNLVEEE